MLVPLYPITFTIPDRLSPPTRFNDAVIFPIKGVVAKDAANSCGVRRYGDVGLL
jgi:hypothetical protein